MNPYSSNRKLILFIRAMQISLLLSFTSSTAHSFVLVSGKSAAHLVGEGEDNEVIFNISPNPPSISGKESFLGGIYANLSDSDFFIALFTEALKPWNSVYGAKLSLNIVLAPNDLAADSEDEQHNVVFADVNRSMAAFAYPNIEGKQILDCDITIAKRKKPAEDLAYTIMHEIGHCLGLGHSHSNLDAVMGYGRADQSLRLSYDDQAGVIFLYPDPEVDGEAMRETMGCASMGPGNKQGGNPLLLLVFLLGLPLLFFCPLPQKYT